MTRRRSESEEPEEEQEELKRTPEEVTAEVTASLRRQVEENRMARTGLQEEDEVSGARRAFLAAKIKYGGAPTMVCLGCGRDKLFAEEPEQTLFCPDCWYTVTRRE